MLAARSAASVLAGASMSGLDFSPAAVAEARELARRSGRTPSSSRPTRTARLKRSAGQVLRSCSPASERCAGRRSCGAGPRWLPWSSRRDELRFPYRRPAHLERHDRPPYPPLQAAGELQSTRWDICHYNCRGYRRSGQFVITGHSKTEAFTHRAGISVTRPVVGRPGCAASRMSGAETQADVRRDRAELSVVPLSGDQARTIRLRRP